MDIGIDHICLDTFLKGVIECKQKRGQCGYLHISLQPLHEILLLLKESIESKLKELEEKYPIHCFLTAQSIDELQESHYRHVIDQ